MKDVLKYSINLLKGSGFQASSITDIFLAKEKSNTVVVAYLFFSKIFHIIVTNSVR